MARTKEAQYEDCLRAAEESGVDNLGVMTNQVWRDDPRRLAILLSPINSSPKCCAASAGW